MQSINLLTPEAKSFSSLVKSEIKIGRTVGVILLLQLAAALMLPFILSKPVTYGSPGFLTAVSAHSFEIRSAILISFFGSALTIYLGIIMFQVFRLYSKSVALLFVVVCAISCTLDIVQAGTMMSMLTLSDNFVASGAHHSEMYRLVGSTVATARRSAHYTQLLAIGAWLFVFYLSMFRFRLIPLALGVIGMIGVLLQFTGVTLMMFIGFPSIGEMAMPMLPIQVTVAVWLMAKGFRERSIATK